MSEERRVSLWRELLEGGRFPLREEVTLMRYLWDGRWRASRWDV
jgi:hypothetical protein